MKYIIPADEFGIFTDRKDRILCDSRNVADYFEKPHRSVLRAIRDLGCSEEFRRCNFVQSNYLNEQNHKQPLCYLTRDGFTLLAMGFTGAKAMQFKEAYIRRFNDMEAQLKELLATRMECPELTDAIKKAYAGVSNPMGINPYAQEFNMLNQIVLGVPTWRFRRIHGIPDHESVRPYMTDQQIKLTRHLQMIDVGLLLVIGGFAERKRRLEACASEFRKKG